MAPRKTASPRPGKKDELAARHEVIETARAMSRRGLSPGRSGNVSRRWAEGMLITPSGMAYDELEPADVTFVDAAGKPSGRRKPSSEWHFHLAIYKAREDVAAVVHAHAMHSVALSCANKPIPAFHYMVAVAGGDDIPCVPYATFGTAELAPHVVRGLAGRNACLMAHHGMVAVGASLSAALELAFDVETLAEQYCKVLTLGPPRLLTAEQMATAIERFRSYGQRAQDET